MKSAEISIYSTVIGIYLIFSLYWVIIFIRRIHSYKIFQKSAYRNILDLTLATLMNNGTIIMRQKFGNIFTF